MPVIGAVKTFDQKFAFQVFIDGFLSASFSKMSALETDIAEVSHSEGGSLLPVKGAGRVTYKDITLERGSTRADFDAYTWFTMAINAPANAGLPGIAYKRHLDVVQRDRAGVVVKRYSVFGAWVKNYVAGDWDNNVDEVVIEKMVLAYDFYQRML